MSRTKMVRSRIVQRARRSRWIQAVWSVGRRLRSPHLVCESVLQWALAAPDASVERVRPASTVKRLPPNTLDTSVHEFFTSFPRSYLVPEKYIARVPGGRLFAGDGLLVLPDGSFSVESIYERRHLLEAPPFRKRLPRNETFYPGDYYSLLIKFVAGSNYYHWLHDGVLRLHEVIERLPADTRFVVPPRRRPFQDETLALIGVSPDRLCELGDGGVARFENLYFSPPSAPTGVDSPEAELWFRERALNAYGIALGPPSRRIYISRRGASYRRIANEPEVEVLLRDLGFEIHELEQYSLHDQVALFAEAEVLVSAHGAGLTNMLFSPPGLVVVDIFESTRFNKCYWSMSTALGHRYWYFIGDTVPSGTTFAGDIHVSLGAFRDLLSAAMTRSDDRTHY
ncbi:MAG TPA: glycosyltransferase family 61 protein [Acidimicrobiales bacterium]|nr:glycosyltransferase family 61 protein [Acidimicrobiales bacterium]